MTRPKEQRGKKVGFTAGAFDLMHVGHVRMFKDCKNVCDYFIVGVQSDPTLDRPDKNKPILSLEERVELVSSLKWVDKVITYNTEADLIRLMERIKPDIRILGSDWEGRNFTGHSMPIKVYFHDRNHAYSTTNLRRRVYEAEWKRLNGKF